MKTGMASSRPAAGEAAPPGPRGARRTRRSHASVRVRTSATSLLAGSTINVLALCARFSLLWWASGPAQGADGLRDGSGKSLKAASPKFHANPVEDNFRSSVRPLLERSGDEAPHHRVRSARITPTNSPQPRNCSHRVRFHPSIFASRRAPRGRRSLHRSTRRSTPRRYRR